MLHLGTFAFVNPWLLAALVILPALWLLLRLTPPSPRLVRFPAIRLLIGLVQSEETPARTPLWLVVLRLLLAVLIIVGLARPVLNPHDRRADSGPLLLVIDDGWAAAHRWAERQQMLASLLDSAEREARPVMVLPTAPPGSGDRLQASGLLPAGEARRLVQALEPLPWPTDRDAAVTALDDVRIPSNGKIAWLSDGVAQGNTRTLAEHLQHLGRVQLVSDPPAALPHLLMPPSTRGSELGLAVVRAGTEGEESVRVRALDDQGHPAGEVPLSFAPGKRVALGRLALPVELRNRIARLEIAGEHTAGATVLLDERWQRRPVGLVAAAPTEQVEALLGGHHYLEQALQPYSEVVQGTVEQLLQRNVAVLALTDNDPLTPPLRKEIEGWIERGGTLLRFAGPRLAQGTDDLVPVRLRLGERELGGAMSWAQPQTLAPFEPESPFSGLAVPADVQVKRQVLAEPSLDLDQKTWARLGDGTPLVTAEPRGQGRLVLIHTTAGPDWSTLPFSGLFVEMLQRIVALSHGVRAAGVKGALPPFKMLNGFGEFGKPPPAASAATAMDLARPQPGPRHPPGYYGHEASRRALNLTDAVHELAPLSALPPGLTRTVYGAQREFDLGPWLIGAATILALVDLMVSLLLRGLLFARRARRATAALGLVLVLAGASFGAPDAHAAPAGNAGDESFALAATGATRLAYVITGDPELDRLSKAALMGLTFILNARTAIEAAAPMAVDPERDELSFFPLLYWPISSSVRNMTPQAIERVSDYLRDGGQILFDTREPDRSAPNWLVLRRLLDDLDLPPLIPVPDDHVLTRSFYLLHDFPGRLTGSTLWVERLDDTVNDGVSSVIIGGNDWAGAWAVDENNMPLMPVVPGGERQRELALRFGVNLAMYALTGNYKADQVHLPAILERLGM